MKQILEKILHESRNTPVKWMQYLMLVVLFGLAFILPIYAVRYQAQQRSGESGTQQIQQPENQDGAQQSGNQDGAQQIQQPGNQDGDQQIQQSGSQESTNGQNGARETGQPAGECRGTIVLDPGHGGSDPGMTGSSGATEKVLNLIYAKKLAVLLEQEGYRVVLTRTTEEGLYDPGQHNQKAQDMQRRCAIIEQENPLLTVSIHQNSYPDPAVRGPQVFYYEHSVEGEKLATLIQNSLNEQLEIERPRVQKSNGSYYILKRSSSITALVEAGFLTNPQEEELLQDETYQDRVVRAICDGILMYLTQEQS